MASRGCWCCFCYSLPGPFARALMDRWDRRWCWWRNTGRASPDRRGRHDYSRWARATVGPGAGRQRQRIRRLRTVSAHDAARTGGTMGQWPCRVGRSPRSDANFMLLPRWHQRRRGASAINAGGDPVSIALLWSLRFGRAFQRAAQAAIADLPSTPVAICVWLHGARTMVQLPTVAGRRFGTSDSGQYQLTADLAPGRRDLSRWGWVSTLLFFAAWAGASWLDTVGTGTLRHGKWRVGCGRHYQVAARRLLVPVMVVCGLLGGQPGESSCAPIRRCR